MTEREHNFTEVLGERIARRMFEFAFEACDRLPAAKKEQVLRDMADRILQRIPSVPTAEEPGAAKITGVEIK